MTRRAAKKPEVEGKPSHVFFVRLEKGEPLLCTCRWRLDVSGQTHSQVEFAKTKHWRSVGELPALGEVTP